MLNTVGSFVSNSVGKYNACCFKRRRWEKFANKHLELLWFSFFVTWTSFPSETHPTGDWIQVAASCEPENVPLIVADVDEFFQFKIGQPEW